CSAGQYLNGDGCATCMAGSYCTGGSYTYNGQIQGQSACPSGYGNSDAGSDSESDCYRACTASDVSNATTVSGRVYSDGRNACDATGCASGYSVQPGDLNTIIGTVEGENVNVNASTFSVDYGSAGSITVRAQCSSQSGTAAWEGDVTISSTLPDSTGRYCYCALDGYTPVGGSAQGLSGPWVFYTDDRVLSLADVCADGCAGLCAEGLQYVGTTDLAFRAALFGSVPSTAQCVPNTYTVSFNANGGTGGQSASVTATYAAAMPAISTTAPTRTGYTFVGWYDDADYASGVQYYTAAGASARNWNKTENATLYAGWTINGYDCKAGEYLNVTACKVCESGYYCPSTAVSYSYNGQIQGRTACPSGYGNSATGSVAQTACYLTTEAGKYVATAQGALTDCPAGDYCTGGVKVNYGSIGGSTPCPDGYRNGAAGYSAESQCLMTVLAGKYVASKNATSATNCAAGTAKTAHTVAYGSMSSCDVCGANQYSDAGAGACSACATDKGYSNSGDVAENHAGVESCKTMCGPGTWVATAGGVCENVGAGYYGAGGIVLQGSISANRGQCVAPLTTIGYGFGANEADDCGRKLHAGSEVIYLRSAPRTSPALNVRVGDDIFYGAMSTALSGKLKVKDVDNTTYSVVNDYQ
ncbi:MAG: InlB B-repeat-containing protein, partial [Alphaproteobacteria bacterium]